MKTGFGIALLLALLSACSPPPKPYAPAAKSPVAAEVLEATPDAAPAWGKVAVPPSKIIPADQIEPEDPRINSLRFGESCIVPSLYYRLADEDRSLWIDPTGRCVRGSTVFNDIRITRIAGGYTADLLGRVSGHKRSIADLKRLDYQRVLEIIP